jgi:flagellar basal-body rod modification protein FlgD
MTTPAANAGSPVVSGTTAPPKTSTPGSAAAASSALASQQIAGNFQSFLTLLTTQLQNQNPLDPLDTNQFTQQLVEFAGVQQQLNTNDSLATLVSLQQATQATQALDYVGKVATVDGATAPLITTQVNGTSVSQAAWELSFPSNATATITISAANGQTAFTGDYNITAGKNQPYLWNGLGNDGTTQWPPGNYTISVTAKDANNNTVAVSTQIIGAVDSVDLTQSPPLLSIGGNTYTVNQINSIVN